jgi:hypothetical protein
MRPVLVVVAAGAIIAGLLAWSRWLAGRRWAAAGHLLLAGTAATAVAGAWPLAAYLAEYDAWAAELPVAEVFFEQTGSSRFRATLTRMPSGRMQVFELTGDQWRLDLRTVRWSERLAPLGPQPRHRIERLASRQAQSGQPAAVHELTSAGAPMPRLGRLGSARGTPLLEARDLTGPWQPMANGARFQVRLTDAGSIETEPRNAVAGDSLASR